MEHPPSRKPVDPASVHNAEELLPLVYDELRRLAAAKLAHESPGQTLQATALVHEAYVRLAAGNAQEWDNRTHFFCAAAEAMRRILIEKARRRRREKHGGRLHRVDLQPEDLIDEPVSDDLLAIDEALKKLEVEDAAKANLIKLRYFVGLTLEEAGDALGISRATASRHWAYAKAWLYRAVTKGGGHA